MGAPNGMPLCNRAYAMTDSPSAEGSGRRGCGMAIPHPRRPLPSALGASVIAYARLHSGIPFGAPMGGLTDIFFLVCCRDDRTHLRVLARLTRLLMQPNF